MKYIFIPFTMFLWYLLSYYGLYISVIGMTFIFSLSWLWLIIGYLPLFAAVFWISNTIPSLLRIKILKIFGMNWITCILHSLAGVIGVVQIIRLYSATPPELVMGNESFFILTGMWKIAPLKTIFLAFPFLGLVISLLWASVIAPIAIKLSGEQI